MIQSQRDSFGAGFFAGAQNDDHGMDEKQQDAHFISRCLFLAKQGAGKTSPNPLVGAIIIKNGKIIAEGYHRRAGLPHAEIDALKKIKFKAKPQRGPLRGGATLYCNLEPCFHHGLTPPCVNQIIKSGISRVVISHRDPNPRVSGRSIRLLKKNKIKVAEGILKKEAEILNRFYLTWIKKKRPYIILKAGISLDGKISYGKSQIPKSKIQRKWITGSESRKRVQEIRSKVDGILVGVNTVIQDDPRLNVRGIKSSKQPVRIILDSKLRTPLRSKIFSHGGGPVLIVTNNSSPSKIRKYERKKAEVLVLDPKKKGRIPVNKLVRVLAKRKITVIVVEGGGEVFSSFYKAGLCDELIFFVAPKILGGKSLDVFPGIKGGSRKFPLKFNQLSFQGRDLEVRFMRGNPY